MTLATGNRCGHDKMKPRFCDIVRQGKGGHPPVLGRVVKLLGKAYFNRNMLSSWQNSNPSGRLKRSEKRETALSLGQFLFTKWVQLDTRRCAVSGGDYLQVPNVYHIARSISQKGWNDEKLSCGRINDVFAEWNKVGYITSKQKRVKKENGKWSASPAIRTFTKKFFLELGGQKLWDDVRKAGVRKLKKLQAFADEAGMPLKEYLSPDWIVTPFMVKRLRLKSTRIALKKQSKTAEARKLPEYKRYVADKAMELFTEHPPEAPPSERWSAAECEDNAKRIADKHFNIS